MNTFDFTTFDQNNFKNCQSQAFTFTVIHFKVNENSSMFRSDLKHEVDGRADAVSVLSTPLQTPNDIKQKSFECWLNTFISLWTAAKLF